jgi:hypothetical protein
VANTPAAVQAIPSLSEEIDRRDRAGELIAPLEVVIDVSTSRGEATRGDEAFPELPSLCHDRRTDAEHGRRHIPWHEDEP